MLKNKVIKIGCSDINYLIGGTTSDTVLVFLPGWAGTIDFWRAQLDFFASRCRVIAIDYPGFGRSTLHYPTFNPKASQETTQAVDSNLTMDRQANLVTAVLEQEKVDTCIMIGHSIGGALALTIASLAPETVQSVIAVDGLVNTALYCAMNEALIKEFTAPFNADFKSTVKSMVGSYLLPDTEAETISWVYNTMASVRPDTAIMILEAFLRWDVGQFLESYQGPVEVLAAKGSYDAQDVWARFGKRVAVTEIADVGHFLMIDKPDEVNRFILARINV